MADFTGTRLAAEVKKNFNLNYVEKNGKRRKNKEKEKKKKIGIVRESESKRKGDRCDSKRKKFENKGGKKEC